MAIDSIYIPTHKHDLRFTRICVASIRHWYPDIRVLLIKDHINGDFSTVELEQRWGVEMFPTEKRCFGWGFSHLEPLFVEEKGRFLLMDSDIVFAGKVLDYLDQFSTDFVVTQESQQPKDISELYFSLEKISEFEPDFEFPPFTFNAGQFVGRGGLISRQDFAGLIDWSGELPRLKRPDVFKNGDQGALNYVVLKKTRLGEISTSRAPFMKWGGQDLSGLALEKIRRDSPYEFLIHWAGLKRPRLREMPRADILDYFENFYYSRLPFGRIQKVGRNIGKSVTDAAKKVPAKFRRVFNVGH